MSSTLDPWSRATLTTTVCALLLVGSEGWASDTATPLCPAPSAASRLALPLPHTAAKLKDSGTLVIVAIGSSSTAGVGASTPANGYPRRLEAELRRRFPNVDLRVLNKGVSGETSLEMEKRFDRDVFGLKPDLVVWQVGTNEVIREDGVTRDEQVVRTGVELLKGAGADVIIMNPQFAPRVVGDSDYRDMLRILDDVGRAEQVPVFDRFDIMRNWVAEGGADLSSITSVDGLHMNDVSYACIARLLADAITRDISPAPDAGTASLAPDRSVVSARSVPRRAHAP